MLTPADTKLAGILIDQLDTLGIKDGDGQERERTRFTLFTEIQIHVEHAHGGANYRCAWLGHKNAKGKIVHYSNLHTP